MNILLAQCRTGLDADRNAGILGYSRQLSSDDIHVISVMARQRVANPGFDRSLTIFGLRNGAVAVMAAFEETDHVGRLWPHTHTLVMNDEAYHALGCNPFHLLRNGTLSFQNHVPRDLPEIVFDTDTLASTMTRQPDATIQRELLVLLVSAALDSKRSLILSSYRCDEIAEATLLMLPRANRSHFTFCTCMMHPDDKLPPAGLHGISAPRLCVVLCKTSDDSDLSSHAHDTHSGPLIDLRVSPPKTTRLVVHHYAELALRTLPVTGTLTHSIAALRNSYDADTLAILEDYAILLFNPETSTHDFAASLEQFQIKALPLFRTQPLLFITLVLTEMQSRVICSHMADHEMELLARHLGTFIGISQCHAQSIQSAIEIANAVKDSDTPYFQLLLRTVQRLGYGHAALLDAFSAAGLPEHRMEVLTQQLRRTRSTAEEMALWFSTFPDLALRIDEFPALFSTCVSCARECHALYTALAGALLHYEKEHFAQAIPLWQVYESTVRYVISCTSVHRTAAERVLAYAPISDALALLFSLVSTQCTARVNRSAPPSSSSISYIPRRAITSIARLLRLVRARPVASHLQFSHEYDWAHQIVWNRLLHSIHTLDQDTRVACATRLVQNYEAWLLDTLRVSLSSAHSLPAHTREALRTWSVAFASAAGQESAQRFVFFALLFGSHTDFTPTLSAVHLSFQKLFYGPNCVLFLEDVLSYERWDVLLALLDFSTMQSHNNHVIHALRIVVTKPSQLRTIFDTGQQLAPKYDAVLSQLACCFCTGPYFIGVIPFRFLPTAYQERVIQRRTRDRRLIVRTCLVISSGVFLLWLLTRPHVTHPRIVLFSSEPSAVLIIPNITNSWFRFLSRASWRFSHITLTHDSTTNIVRVTRCHRFPTNELDNIFADSSPSLCGVLYHSTTTLPNIALCTVSVPDGDVHCTLKVKRDKQHIVMDVIRASMTSQSQTTVQSTQVVTSESATCKFDGEEGGTSPVSDKKSD